MSMMEYLEEIKSKVSEGFNKLGVPIPSDGVISLDKLEITKASEIKNYKDKVLVFEFTNTTVVYYEGCDNITNLVGETGKSFSSLSWSKIIDLAVSIREAVIKSPSEVKVKSEDQISAEDFSESLDHASSSNDDDLIESLIDNHDFSSNDFSSNDFSSNATTQAQDYSQRSGQSRDQSNEANRSVVSGIRAVMMQRNDLLMKSKSDEANEVRRKLPDSRPSIEIPSTPARRLTMREMIDMRMRNNPQG